jgi:hypothetical protein
MKLKIFFFCNFPNPWAFRVSGMGGYTSKCEKSQNHCTLLCIPSLAGRYDNPIPPRFLTPIDFLKIPAQEPEGVCTDKFLSRKLAFCFQLCTVTHFVGFLPLPWFSCSLVFFPYSCIRFGGFFVSCMENMEKNVGGLYLFGCKNYISLTCLNGFLAIFNFDNIF